MIKTVQLIQANKTIDENSIQLLLNEKKQLISQTEILEYWSANETISKIVFDLSPLGICKS